MSSTDASAYFTYLLAHHRNLAFFVTHLYCEGGDPTTSRLVILRDEKWYHLADIATPVHGFLTRRGTAHKPGDICALGRRGLLTIWSRGQAPRSTDFTPKVGYLHCMKEVAGTLYAAGTQRQLYRYSDEQGSWHAQDEGMYTPLIDQVSGALDAIDGYAADDLYAAGSHGALWHWDGLRWRALDSGTQWGITALLCGAGGEVYFTTARGQLFRGSRSRGWTAVNAADDASPAYTSLALFQDRLYIAAGRKLLSYDGATLADCGAPLPARGAIALIAACDEALWCMLNEDVLMFDGEAWKQYQPPA